MNNTIIYTVTAIDVYTDPILGIRRTPAVFTSLDDAIYVVKNNLHDLSDSTSYQYVVIEESRLNQIRPNVNIDRPRLWFKYNSVTDEFVQCTPPVQLRNQSGFGIG